MANFQTQLNHYTQYYLDYKEFKQKAAAERFLRGKDFVEKN